MQNFNLRIAKMSDTPKDLLFPNPVLPKTSVLNSPRLHFNYIFPDKEPLEAV